MTFSLPFPFGGLVNVFAKSAFMKSLTGYVNVLTKTPNKFFIHSADLVLILVVNLDLDFDLDLEFDWIFDLDLEWILGLVLETVTRGICCLC